MIGPTLMTSFHESEVEEAALAWLEGLGWSIKHGPDIAPGTSEAERDNYDQVVLEQRLTDAIDNLNPDLPTQAREDVLRKLTRPEGATLETRNRSFHRMLVDGVSVDGVSRTALSAGIRLRWSTSITPGTTTASPSTSSP